MTLNDDTEITHSEMLPDGKVKVYIEIPDDFGDFIVQPVGFPTINGKALIDTQKLRWHISNN